MNERAPTFNFEVDEPDVDFVFATIPQDDIIEYVTANVLLLFGEGRFSVHGEYNDAWYALDAGYATPAHTLIDGKMIPCVNIVYDDDEDDEDDPPPSSDGGEPGAMPVEYEIQEPVRKAA